MNCRMKIPDPRCCFRTFRKYKVKATNVRRPNTGTYISIKHNVEARRNCRSYIEKKSIILRFDSNEKSNQQRRVIISKHR